MSSTRSLRFQVRITPPLFFVVVIIAGLGPYFDLGIWILQPSNQESGYFTWK